MAIDETTPLFGQIALRDLVLPDLLGDEQSDILYWAGRSLAEKLPTKEADIPGLFAQLGLGTLANQSQKRQQREYRLDGSTVAARLKDFDKPDFQLEAGLLAQLLQQQLGVVVEGNSQVLSRDQAVLITISLDTRDKQPIIDDLID
ncbi:hydrocarbon binding protein, V4R domain [Lacticaseibacillus brantae DSM 23927]|uniref:Hydrocarbon binding protein, V4R domain n=2 Tax=Lacticaseibacillus brantae TaxID=943673 RepID=A0A0R2B0K9_9LACO|nr:hydrocarbon binding protein, V4R domain [Lacticaseibacillus brantae DSM 23927]